MNALLSRLEKIEARLKTLIEARLARWILLSGASGDLAYQLVEALRAGVCPGPGSDLLAPNHFSVRAGPRLAALLDDPARLGELAALLRQAGEESGLRFAGPLALDVELAPSLAPEAVQVSAQIAPIELTATDVIEAEPHGGEGPPPGYCLVIDGTRRFALRRVVVDIGRLPANHLVIDELSVSRRHAQLRYSGEAFVLIDLNSTGGTYLNGQPVQQARLQDGDLISLAGVPLLFRREDAILLQETQEYVPPC